MSETKKLLVELKKQGDLFITELYGKRYGFRKWTWGEKNQLSNKCTHIDPLSNITKFDTAHFNERLFLATVRKEADGKFVNFTLEEIRKAEGQLMDTLLQITQKLNLVQPFETQNL